MNDQTIASRGSSLKKVGIGLLSAGIFTLVTACSTVVLPAPEVAPVVSAPVASVPSAQRQSLEFYRYTTAPKAVQPLEMFRYTGQLSAIASDRPLEMFRYTAKTDAIAPSSSAKPSLEMFRYTGQLSAVAAARPVEFFRYTTQAAVIAPASSSKQPLEMFRYQSALSASAQASETRHSLEIYRYTRQPQIRQPLSLPR